MNDTTNNPMEENKAIKTNISNVIKELEVLANSIDVKRIEFIDEVTAQLSKLDETIASLKKETVLINTTPQKLTNQLAQIIPDIAVELNKLSLKQIKEFKLAQKQNIEEHNKAIIDAASKLKQVKEEIYKIDSMRVKRYFINLGSVMIISVFASLWASYVLMKEFPNKVYIESPEQVAVQNSDVSLWYSKSVKTSGKEKIMKY